MPRRSLTVEQVLSLLAETPPRIAQLTDGLAPNQLHASPNPDEWSAKDVLVRLRACADAWADCIAVNIAQDTPTLRTVIPVLASRKRIISSRNFGPRYAPLLRSVPTC